MLILIIHSKILIIAYFEINMLSVHIEKLKALNVLNTILSESFILQQLSQLEVIKELFFLHLVVQGFLFIFNFN